MVSAKYRTPEYLAAYRALRAAQKRGDWLVCAQPVCLMPSRDIGPDQSAHVGHDDSGNEIIGPVHERCNVVDGGRRGNQVRNGVKWWPL